jgi:SAM-dependent methyltransferase
VDWARTCGFPVVAAGRGHKWLPHFSESTPETVWGYYGLTPEQAERRNAQKIKDKILDLAGCRIPGFFPTPAALAVRMIEEADIRPGDEVLEPSAGTGNLADAARDAGGRVTCIELRPALCEILRMKGHQVTKEDFTDLAPIWKGLRFDRVILNPPFENGQDADHVRHAYGFLKAGGRLVAIMSEGVFFRADSRSSEFRAWLSSVGGISEKLPEGTFQGTGEVSTTGTNTRIVIINR